MSSRSSRCCKACLGLRRKPLGSGTVFWLGSQVHGPGDCHPYCSGDRNWHTPRRLVGPPFVVHARRQLRIPVGIGGRHGHIIPNSDSGRLPCSLSRQPAVRTPAGTQPRGTEICPRKRLAAPPGQRAGSLAALPLDDSSQALNLLLQLDHLEFTPDGQSLEPLQLSQPL